MTSDKLRECPTVIYAGSRLAPAIAVMESGDFKHWVLVRHPDGQWVSAGKLPDTYIDSHAEEVSVESPATEDDGCPTEGAVLKRFWREHSTRAADEKVKALVDDISKWRLLLVKALHECQHGYGSPKPFIEQFLEESFKYEALTQHEGATHDR